MAELLISVIIPTLNEEKYLEQTINSIKNQDYKGRYEIIVADGNSDDDTVRIARKNGARVILADKRGIAAGRNAGAKIAKGKILFFVDADTMLSFNTLSEVSKAFKNREVVGATCPIIPISCKASDFFIYWFYDQFAKATIGSNPQVAGMCCAYRKDSLEKVGGFDERFKTYEDIDFSKRISDIGQMVFVDSTVAMTSPRRLEKWGRRRATRKYIISYLGYLLTGRTMTGVKYKPIR